MTLTFEYIPRWGWDRFPMRGLGQTVLFNRLQLAALEKAGATVLIQQTLPGGVVTRPLAEVPRG